MSIDGTRRRWTSCLPCDDGDADDVAGISDDWTNRSFPSNWILNFLLGSFLFLNFEPWQQPLHDDDGENDADGRMFPVIQLNYLEMVTKNHEWNFDLIN